MHTLVRIGFAAACGCLLLGPARAQPSPSTVQAADPATIVVTGARLPQPAQTSPLDLRVIDRATIARAGVSSLGELLRREAGVEFSATGGVGQPSSLFLRGSNANHVVLLVDGVRVNSATTGTNAFEHLALEQIERVEVLLGPASGLYGADAIGGVIQVFTRQDDGVSARVGVGSEGTRSASASAGLVDGRSSGGLTVSWRQTDAASATNAANAFSFNADDDPYRNRSLSAWLKHRAGADHTLALRLTRANTETAFDAGPGSDDRNRQRLGTLSLESRDRWSSTWRSVLRIARGNDDLATAGSFPGAFSTEQDQLSWQHDVDVLGGTGVLGVEYRHEKIDSTTAYTTDERRVRALFGGWSGEVAPGYWLQAALRHDDDSQFGGNGTGNLGWRFAFAPGWSVSAAAGTAFKAPSFNDLYFPLSFGYSGNPDLQPERSRSVEAGLRYAAGAWSAGATAFDNRIRDLIVINDSFTTVDNVARARIRGLTLQGRWANGPWSVRADATWQTPRNADADTRLVRRADRFASAGLDWAAGAWRLGAEWTATGTRFDDGANSAAARLGGYALLNLRAAWMPAPGWELAARLDNATDKAYTLVRGYDTPGRGLFVSLAWDGR